MRMPTAGRRNSAATAERRRSAQRDGRYSPYNADGTAARRHRHPCGVAGRPRRRRIWRCRCLDADSAYGGNGGDGGNGGTVNVSASSALSNYRDHRSGRIYPHQHRRGSGGDGGDGKGGHDYGRRWWRCRQRWQMSRRISLSM
ncbi:MAG: hypothetical protein HPM95_15250 [Alphaproteobacteria bacterium]|nr:hypothetical protein [Alphaproteobacteria bacterium]